MSTCIWAVSLHLSSAFEALGFCACLWYTGDYIGYIWGWRIASLLSLWEWSESIQLLTEDLCDCILGDTGWYVFFWGISVCVSILSVYLRVARSMWFCIKAHVLWLYWFGDVCVLYLGIKNSGYTIGHLVNRKFMQLRIFRVLWGYVLAIVHQEVWGILCVPVNSDIEWLYALGSVAMMCIFRHLGSQAHVI